MSASLTYPNTKRGLMTWGNLFVDKLKAQMRIDKTVASGETLRSIQPTVDGTTLGILSEARAGVPILQTIDEGTKGYKAMPPIHQIVQWMKAKGIQPKRDRQFVRGTEHAYKRSAFQIARAIQQRGTIKRFGHTGSGILDFTVGKLLTQFDNIVMKGYEKDVSNHFQERYNKLNSNPKIT